MPCVSAICVPMSVVKPSLMDALHSGQSSQSEQQQLLACIVLWQWLPEHRCDGLPSLQPTHLAHGCVHMLSLCLDYISFVDRYLPSLLFRSLVVDRALNCLPLCCVFQFSE